MHTDPCTHSCSRAASAARRRVCTALAPGCNTRARMLRREYLCTAAHAGAHKDAFVTQPLRRAGGERARHARTSEQSSSSSVSVTALPRPDQARGAGGSPAPSQGPPVRCARMRACTQARTHACAHVCEHAGRAPSIHASTHQVCMHACTLHASTCAVHAATHENPPRALVSAHVPIVVDDGHWQDAHPALCVLTVSLLTASGSK